MSRITVDGYAYETDLDVAVGDEVLLPDSGTGQWVGTVTSLRSDYRGPCRRVAGLVRRRAEVERREAARRAVKVAGWRPGESVEIRYGGTRRVAMIVEVNSVGRPTYVKIEADPPVSIGLGSAAAWRDLAAGLL
jgi:hypothetical protein